MMEPRSQSIVLLVAALAIVALLWPARHAWQWARVHRAYTDAVLAEAPTITPKHVKALRRLRFAWTTLIESGGPIVDPLRPYGSSDIVSDLGPITGSTDPVALAKFHIEVSAVLIWALQHCNLPDGQYPLAHLNNASMQERLRRDLKGLPPARIDAVLAELPRLSPDGQFRFTDQHRRLLRALRFQWPAKDMIWIIAQGGYPVPAVHFKRPFGDMTAFDIDMAAILGLPSPANDRLAPLLVRLYWELWPALQTFVEHAAIPANGG